MVTSSSSVISVASQRARAVATLILLGLSCACHDATPEGDGGEAAETPSEVEGKADQIGSTSPVVVAGACAFDAPADPYLPIPEPTLAVPEGPESLLTRVGHELPVRSPGTGRLAGEFAQSGCGRHYFVFTLDRRSELVVRGSSASDGHPAPLGLCFLRPHFLRIDAAWFDPIWQKEDFADQAPPCGSFVPVDDRLEPATEQKIVLPAGSYDLLVDHLSVSAQRYDLTLELEPVDDAVCGNGLVEGDETCDDGGQLPLDWCGADCRTQRLDVEPLPGNETIDTAQSLDGFRRVRFHAVPEEDELDVYSIRLDAGETLVLTKGERICRESTVRVFGPDRRELPTPWDCEDMTATVSFTADQPGEYYLQVETVADGARSISGSIH